MFLTENEGFEGFHRDTGSSRSAHDPPPLARADYPRPQPRALSRAHRPAHRRAEPRPHACGDTRS